MTYLAKQYDLVVTSAPGLSDLLAKELSTLSLKVTTAGSAAISLKGSVEDALRICLYSRLAERVLCRLVQCKVAPREAAEALAKAFDWGTHLAKAQAVHVEVSATKKAGVNALAVSRDFISQAPFQLNLSADARDALTLHLYISETTSELAIDLSGETLQRRGYRLAGGKAPLRETLAAAMLLVAEWQGDIALIDPFVVVAPLQLKLLYWPNVLPLVYCVGFLVLCSGQNAPMSCGPSFAPKQKNSKLSCQQVSPLRALMPIYLS